MKLLIQYIKTLEACSQLIRYYMQSTLGLVFFLLLYTLLLTALLSPVVMAICSLLWLVDLM